MDIFEVVADGVRFAAQQLGMQYTAIICLGLILLAIIVIIQSIRSSYETRILKSIDKFNKYFSKQPFINDENLVEFNARMKKVPRILRNRWQMFMLNREDVPTKYINLDTCVEKPLRTSLIERNMNNFVLFTGLVCFVGLLFGLCVANETSVLLSLFQALLIPAITFLISAIFILIVRSWKNAIHADLYENFHIFEQNLNRAVTTLPAYVDYEILFTKKEIKDGIPILQQYLEKRAFLEQQELEKARQNAVETESYNFEELGINGSLVLERAMKECETYIGNRRRLLSECGQIESEKESFAKNYDATEKDYQRKLQASRENMESLKAQQEQSTNRIESNYIRKQLADEIKKQQQLEKDSDEAAAKFKEEQASLDAQVAKRKEEIEEKRVAVEAAMLLEFKNYANIMYKKLADAAQKATAAKLEKLSVENDELKELLKTFQTDKLDVLSLIDNIELKADKSVEDKGLYDNEQESIPDTLYDQTGAPNDKIEDVKAKSVFDMEEQKEMVIPDAVPAQPTFVAPTPAAPVMPQAPVAPATLEVATPSQDELNDIQKKIEEENANLFKQKQEFENQINNTISKIDNDGDDEDGGQKPEASVQIPDVKPAPAPAPAPEPEPEPEVEEEEPAPAPTPAAKPTAAAPKKTLTKTSAAPKKTLSKSTAPKPAAKKSGGSDDIDDINSEMEDLLNSLND